MEKSQQTIISNVCFYKTFIQRTILPDVFTHIHHTLIWGEAFCPFPVWTGSAEDQTAKPVISAPPPPEPQLPFHDPEQETFSIQNFSRLKPHFHKCFAVCLTENVAVWRTKACHCFSSVCNFTQQHPFHLFTRLKLENRGPDTITIYITNTSILCQKHIALTQYPNNYSQPNY